MKNKLIVLVLLVFSISLVDGKCCDCVVNPRGCGDSTTTTITVTTTSTTTTTTIFDVPPAAEFANDTIVLAILLTSPALTYLLVKAKREKFTK